MISSSELWKDCFAFAQGTVADETRPLHSKPLPGDLSVMGIFHEPNRRSSEESADLFLNRTVIIHAAPRLPVGNNGDISVGPSALGVAQTSGDAT